MKYSNIFAAGGETDGIKALAMSTAMCVGVLGFIQLCAYVISNANQADAALEACLNTSNNTMDNRRLFSIYPIVAPANDPGDMCQAPCKQECIAQSDADGYKVMLEMYTSIVLIGGLAALYYNCQSANAKDEKKAPLINDAKPKYSLQMV